MSTPTAARTFSKDASHWYHTDGQACHTVERADKSGRRPTTLRDARKLNLLPSVTNILKLLHKEALVNWQIEQAVLAVLTTPRKEGEADDAFVERVLHVEEVQHAERDAARDLGIQIHDGLEYFLVGMQCDEKILPYIGPAAEAIKAFGTIVETETNLVGYGYAGRTDLIQDAETHWCMTDYKGSKTLPDPNKGGAWLEHRLQLAAYAKAWHKRCERMGMDEKPILLRNVYISTLNVGEYVICEHEEPWEEVYANGFAPLVKHWQWANGYKPDLKGLEDEPIADLAGLEADPAELRKEAAVKTPPVNQTPKPAVNLNPAAREPFDPAKVTVLKGRKVVITEGVRVNPTPPRQ